jgi:hypothetical protein
MMPSQTVIQGTLKPDGTLELDEKPNLPPGRVEVLLRAVPPASPPAEDWWQFLQRVRAEREASGHRFRTKEEIDADLEDLRSDNERLEELYREIERRDAEK